MLIDALGPSRSGSSNSHRRPPDRHMTGDRAPRMSVRRCSWTRRRRRSDGGRSPGGRSCRHLLRNKRAEAAGRETKNAPDPPPTIVSIEWKGTDPTPGRFARSATGNANNVRGRTCIVPRIFVPSQDTGRECAALVRPRGTLRIPARAPVAVRDGQGGRTGSTICPVAIGERPVRGIPLDRPR